MLTGKSSLAAKGSSVDHSIPGHCAAGVGGGAGGGRDSVYSDAIHNR